MAPSLSSVLFALLPLASASALPKPSPAVVKVTNADSPAQVDGSWLVVWKKDMTNNTIAARQAKFAATLRKRSLTKRDANGTPMAMKSTNHAIGTFRATTCDTDGETMSLMLQDAQEDVAYVEATQWITMFQGQGATRQEPTVDLDINALQQARAKDTGPKGEGTTAYVLDTGVNSNHTVFGGRATLVECFVPGEPCQDLNGHGTHCAGSIAGNGTGVAPEGKIRAFKILDKDGAGSSDSILRGLQATVDDSRANNLAGKCAISMSLGTERSNAINSAAEQAAQLSGCVMLVAAGNEDRDAAAVSPASADGVITVGATDSRTGKIAPFSNQGADVDIFVNGDNVVSADAKNITGFKPLTGTSMSCPQAAGKALQVLSTGKISCSSDCTQVVKQSLQQEAANERPVKGANKGILESTTLQLNTSGEVPVQINGPTPVGAGGRPGGASQGGDGIGNPGPNASPARPGQGGSPGQGGQGGPGQGGPRDRSVDDKKASEEVPASEQEKSNEIPADPPAENEIPVDETAKETPAADEAADTEAPSPPEQPAADEAAADEATADEAAA